MVSRRNSSNREMHGPLHNTGRKHFSQLRYEMQQVGEEIDKMSVWKKSRDMSNVDVAEAIRTYEEYLLKEPEDQRNLRVVKDRVFHLVMGGDGHGYYRTYGSSVPRNLVYPQSSTTYESSNDLVQQITESLTKHFDEKFERIEARLNIFEKRLNILENKERNNNGQVLDASSGYEVERRESIGEEPDSSDAPLQ